MHQSTAESRKEEVGEMLRLSRGVCLIWSGEAESFPLVSIMDWGQTTIEGRDKFAFRAVCAEFVLARRTADALVGDSSGLHC